MKNLMKSLKWVGSSRKDLIRFPLEVRREIGYALYLAQKGEIYSTTKQFKGHGSGVYEIVSDYDKNAYRTVYYVADSSETVFVIHAFQKKSKKGIKTPKEVMVVIRQRLKSVKSTS